MYKVFSPTNKYTNLCTGLCPSYAQLHAAPHFCFWVTRTPFTRTKKIGMACQIFGTIPRLPMRRLPPGDSLGTPKILSTDAKSHLGPICLHVENWECRALKSSAQCQKFGVPCRFF